MEDVQQRLAEILARWNPEVEGPRPAPIAPDREPPLISGGYDPWDDYWREHR